MKVFFSMRHLGSLRLYESVIREMAARGDQVHLALGRAEALGWEPTLDALVAQYPTITWSWLSPPPAFFWAEIAKTIRLWADYLRYFDAAYASTPRLLLRAEALVPPRLVRISRMRLFARPKHRRRLLSALRALERALPLVPEIEQQLRERRPDVVLVTPLIYLGTSQFDVLRAALALGQRTAFCVGSWDHLSSKALIRDMPHRVFVWNQAQRAEAVDLHRVPPERVVVTGAQCFDEWFGRQPSRSREQFAARVGLPADRPMLLYVCSALFLGSPSEALFVREWIGRLRSSRHKILREASVLVRPHPQRTDEWSVVDLAEYPSVAVHGSNPVDTAAKDDYFDALFYSSAIVGLNTTAFLEGAIVGRPVHTILRPEFHENQRGTLHFQYLLTVGGGVLRASESFDEHEAQLASALEARDDRRETQFVQEFLRPHGVGVRATTAFCDAVETFAQTPAPRAESTPLRFVLLRWALYPTLWLLHRLYGSGMFRDDSSRDAIDQERRRQARERERRAREQAGAAVKAARARRRTEKMRTRDAALAAARAEAVRVKAEKAAEKARRQRVRQRGAGRQGALGARLKRAANRWFGRSGEVV